MTLDYNGTRDTEQNLQLVLDKLGRTINRKARFKTVISLIYKGSEYFFEGVAEGKIAEKRSGNKGFGYDPIFQPDDYDITFADMSLTEKNSISHRAKAVEQLASFLKTQV
jgi:XTP/dITP diphosphohydrolase